MSKVMVDISVSNKDTAQFVKHDVMIIEFDSPFDADCAVNAINANSVFDLGDVIVHKYAIKL